MTTLYRATTLAADTTGRTLYGVAMPYGQVAEVRDGFGPSYREMFAPGAFARSIRERGHKVRLFVQHETRKLPIGRATELDEHPDGLHASFAVARTRDGDEALELVQSGVVDGFSVGFAPIRDQKRDGVVTRLEAALREVSLVHSPAYEGAGVAGVRGSTDLTVDVARRRLRLVLARYPHHADH